MATILGANTLSSGFNVDTSLLLTDASDNYLNRTHGSSPTSQKKMTISFWIKKLASKVSKFTQSDGMMILGGQQDSYPGFHMTFLQSTDTFIFRDAQAANNVKIDVRTDAKFRDPAAWNHFCVVVDTTDGTAANRVKFFINGTQTLLLNGSTTSGGGADSPLYPDQNYDTRFNGNEAHFIGKYGSNYEDCILSQYAFIDGLALAPTSFGEFDSDTPNVWKPKDISGLTFGTNGFFLDFADSSDLGKDVSGNGNHYTNNSMNALHQVSDTCTNNYATMNGLDHGRGDSLVITNGGNDVATGGTARGVVRSTIAVSSGKWYVEVNPDSASGGNSYIGVSANTNDYNRGANDYLGARATDYGYYQDDGKVYTGTTGATYGNSYSNGNIIGVYLDLDNNKLYFSINGTLQNSGTGISVTDVANTNEGAYFFCVGDDNAYAERRFETNFGNPIRALSSAVSDDNGYGNFEYSPNITGDSVAKKFYALNTKNLAEYG